MDCGYQDFDLLLPLDCICMECEFTLKTYSLVKLDAYSSIFDSALSVSQSQNVLGNRVLGENVSGNSFSVGGVFVTFAFELPR